MSERKVLNKYYPPEFDPSKIPRLRVKKTGVFSIRIMAPFNMRCDNCGEYIYKGKKFNSRKENVDDEDYLGLRIFRFYIRCPRCISEIAFKTDLAKTDYALEAGATRLFEAERLAHEMAEKERKEKEEDELNPMKLLENRTKASRNEIEQIDQLEELKEMNARHARVDHKSLLEKHMVYEEQLLKLQEEEEDQLVKAIMDKARAGPTIKRLHDDDSGDEDQVSTVTKIVKVQQDTPESTKPSDVLVDKQSSKSVTSAPSWQRSVGTFSKKTSLAGLVKKKTPNSNPSSSSSSLSSSSLQVSPATSNSKPDSQGIGCSGVAASKFGGASVKSAAQGCENGQTSSVAGEKSVTGLGLLGGYSDSDDSCSSD